MANVERNFFIRTYLNEQTLQMVLARNVNTIARSCYIVHDKDIKNDGTLVTEHIHLCLRFTYQRSINAVLSLFPKVNIGDTLEQATYVEFMVSEDRAIRYLLHLDDADKYQYDRSLLVNSGYRIDTYLDNVLRGVVRTDISVYALQDLLNGDTWEQVAKRYGREFIYHVSSYKLLLSLIDSQDRYNKNKLLVENVNAEDFGILNDNIEQIKLN